MAKLIKKRGGYTKFMFVQSCNLKLKFVICQFTWTHNYLIKV